MLKNDQLLKILALCERQSISAFKHEFDAVDSSEGTVDMHGIPEQLLICFQESDQVGIDADLWNAADSKQDRSQGSQQCHSWPVDGQISQFSQDLVKSRRCCALLRDRLR